MRANTSPTRLHDQIARELTHGERLDHCVQCGTCGGSCPNGAEMDHTPRELVALVHAGQNDEVLRSNTPWKCVSCYACTSRCPRKIPVTELMYTLKRIAMREGYVQREEAPALARVFVDNLDRYGRSFELGLASRYYLTRKPASLIRMGPLGIAMMKRGRMSLVPNRIRELDQLRTVVDRARQLGGGAT